MQVLLLPATINRYKGLLDKIVSSW